MPYADNQGVRIHYQVEGEGLPLVLHHGRGNRLESWYQRGYVDPLKRDYRLILMDARGHGRSDRPRRPEAYSRQVMAADVLAVLDDLGIAKAHYFGYSMGGRVGFALAKHAPQRFHSLIIGGMHPYKLPAENVQERIAALRRGIAAYAAWMEATAGLTPERRALLLQEDPEALIAFTLAFQKDDDLEAALPNMTMPSLFFVGEADEFCPGVKECVKRIPSATFVSLPGLNHLQTIDRSDLALPHISAFLKEVGQKMKAAV